MKKINKDILTLIILALISIIIFSITSIVDWTLLTGFLIGLLLSILYYLFNNLFVYKLLSKRRTFKLSFLLCFFKVFGSIIFFGATFIGILFANNLIGKSLINGVFNVFSFIYGSIIVSISVFVNRLIEVFTKTYKKHNKGSFNEWHC